MFSSGEFDDNSSVEDWFNIDARVAAALGCAAPIVETQPVALVFDLTYVIEQLAGPQLCRSGLVSRVNEPQRFPWNTHAADL